MTSDISSVKVSTSFTEDEQHVAGNALNFFQAGQYDATLGILKKLQKTHPNNIRLMHNKILAEFCKSGKTKIQEYRRNLIKFQKQLQQIIKDDEEGMGSVEKNYHTVLSYNQALLLYNLHQYSDAEIILERLCEYLDAPDDLLPLKIYFLFIDVYLHNHKIEKANALIALIEKNLQNLKEKSNNEEKVQSHHINLESLEVHLHYLKTLCSLQLKAVKTYKKEIKAFTNQGNPPNSQNGFVNVASVFLKSNFENVRGNFHKAYRILGSSPPPSLKSNVPPDDLNAIFYNDLALIHFNLEKYSIGSFYMQKALHENDYAMQSATKNFYSSLSQSGGKHHHQQMNSAKPLSAIAVNRKFELLYNCGLHLLYAGNPSQAFDCLLASIPAFRTNPRLWLRLAECCIQKCTVCPSDMNIKNKKFPQYQDLPPYTVVGNGNHQKIVINTIQSGGKINNVVMPAPNLQFASVCLRNALTILRIAVNVTNESNEQLLESQDDNTDVIESKKPGKLRTVVPCSPGTSVSGLQLEHLFGCVLINSAFVALCLGNPQMALEYTQALFSRSTISPCHRYLANLYASEALVYLDRISEAIPYLSTDKISSISNHIDGNGKKSPVSDDGCSKSNHSNNSHNHEINSKFTVSQWSFPSNITCAHAYMLINLAHAHSLRSEYEKALGLIQQATSLVGVEHVPPQTLLLSVYSQLLHGGDGISTAIQLLRHNTPVLTISSTSNVPDDKSLYENSQNRMQSSIGNGINPGDSSSSSTTSSASRSKSSTPQPSAGSTTPERPMKSKGHEKKRNRR